MKESLEEKIESRAKAEKESPQKRVFVEVGTNKAPVPFAGRKEFGSNDVYIGIDLAEESVRGAREYVKDAAAAAERDESGKNNLFFLSADAKSLPLREKSVDELYFGNVFGYPAIEPPELLNFLSEARRVLKSSGKIIIKENNTPADLEFLRKMLKQKGFAVKKLVRAGDKNWEEEISLYDKYPPVRDSYILEAGKISE